MKELKKRFNVFRLSLFAVCFIFALLLSGNSGDVKAAGTGMKIHVIDLKEHGDAVVIESSGEYIIMDLGSYTDFASISSYLRGLGVNRISLYYSHFDPDHSGGMGNGKFGIDNLMNNFTVTHVYLPDPGVSPYGNIREYSQAVEEHYAKKYSLSQGELTSRITYLKVGSTFGIGDAAFRVIGPVGVSSLTVDNTADDDDDTGNYVNNCSLVSMVTCGTTKYLSTGDSKTEQEDQLIKEYGAGGGLKADIYKMSHHGLTPANSDKFMSYVKPSYSFAQNAGFTGNIKFGDGKRMHRRTFASREACSQYGFCYMVGDEKKTLIINVNNDRVTLEKAGSGILNAQGWTKVYGSDGVDKLYDYYYFDANGKPLTGVQIIDGKYYYLGTGGCRNAGTYVYTSGKKTYRGWEFYKNAQGKEVRRYFDEKTDEMYTGFHKIDKSLYYFETDSGLLRTGDKNGTRQKIGKYYYAIYKGGSICTSGARKYSKGTCYFDSKGRMRTGWYTEKKNKYYLDPETGFRCIGVKEIKGKYYFFNTWGMLKTNTNVSIDGKLYRTNSKGAVQSLPKAPTVSISKVKRVSSSTAQVYWKKNTKASGYEIYYAQSKGGAYKKAGTVKKNSTTSYKIRGMKKGQKYYIKIRSYKKFGSAKIYSKNSKVKSIIL